MLDLINAAKHRLIGEIVELFTTQIVVAPFHVTDIELAFAVWKKGQFKERDIFLKQLLLKIFCASRNDDALTGTDNGNEVSQSLAGAGPSLDNQMTLFFERLLYRLRHLQLSLPELVCRVSA